VVALLDLNVLIALAWPNHVHHGRTASWFRAHHAGGWATCPTTQSGFVRVSSNRRVIAEAKTPQEAALYLRELVALPGHAFLADDLDWTRSTWIAPARIHGYRQVSDAHLLGLALRHGARLVTLDHALRGLLPPGHGPDRVACLLEDPMDAAGG
jgi:toxin-antitoxin system PIN domain toxin